MVHVIVMLSLFLAAPQQTDSNAQLAETVAAAVAQRYVFPDIGEKIAAHVRARAAAGAYDKLAPAQLVDALTQDLRVVNRDRHLYVQYQAGGGGRQGGSAPGGGAPVRMTPGASPQSLELARRRNYYLNSAQRLDGNVGYLDVRRFFGATEEARDAAAGAMAFLADVDAMIIDVRYTPGGDARMVDLLASYFFDKVTPTLHTYSRPRNETIQRTTLESVPGKRRPTIPLYVLTSRDTGSAAEDFAFLLQQTGRATLVGDRTAGAGHTNAILGIGGGYSLSVSIGRTFNPKTNEGWEGVGVQPTVKVAAAGALDTAHRLALTALIEKTQDAAVKQELAWTREALEARRTAVVVDAKTLQSYAGQYGTRFIRFEQGRIWYQRAEGAELLLLLPLSATEFAGGEGQRIRFETAGGTLQLRMLMTDGTSLTYAREG